MNECLTCRKPIKGRSDKKFCDSACRNTFNNRIKQYRRQRPKGIQQLANAQVEVNRVVFEANKSDPRAEYITSHVNSAITDLNNYLEQNK